MEISMEDLLKNGTLLFSSENVGRSDKVFVTINVFIINKEIHIIDLQASGRGQQAEIAKTKVEKILYDTESIRFYVGDYWYQSLHINVENIIKKNSKTNTAQFEVKRLGLGF